MEATFPSRGLTRAFLLVGALSAAATCAVFAWSFRSDPSGFVWIAPFLGAYAAGVTAFLTRPDLVAARRLLVFGVLATTWIGATVALAVAFDEQGERWWLAPGNVGVQFAGLGMEAAMIALLAVYPDGRYGRPYERRIVKIAVGLAVALPLALLVTRPSVQPSWGFAWDDGTGTSFPTIESPLHLEAVGVPRGPLRGLLDASLALGPLVAAVLAGLRYRRLEPAQRAQVRWPMYGVLLLILMPLAALLDEFGALPGAAVDAVVIVALVALPTSVMIGLVRPDLLDLDRTLGRTLVYAPLWLAIAAAYVGIAAALGTAASALGLQITVAVAIVATLLVEPVRRRLVRRAARWAKGKSLSGEEMIDWLGRTMEHRLDPDELTAALAKAASGGLGVRWTTIRVEGQDPVTHGEMSSADAEPSMSATMTYAGELLGEIECGPRRRGRVRPSDIDTLETLARQAAVTIHNARLASDLRSSVEEVKTQAAALTASRSRLVAAEASARRQIERDIHDGAQQELVALIAKIGLLRNQLGPDSDGLDATFDELQAEAREALENLRRLAAGIHPTELTDHGLVEAIEGRSARLPMGVTITCAPELRSARFDEHIEGAAYFFVSEGLANALKHAGTARARVLIARSTQHLELEVTDDGVGFECNGVTTPGLRGLADRMEALGGGIAVESAPGRGTRLRARLPIGGPHVDQ